MAKLKKGLIFVLKVQHLDHELKDILDDYYESPDYHVITDVNVLPNRYYKVANDIAWICQQKKYAQYYLLAVGPPILLVLIAAKILESIGKFKCIETDAHRNVRSLDVP
ncbi:MAG: hypothetical protein ACXADF_18200 [Candidatus Thorarchaeota archaeon]|jgi:hypothetical protein